MKMRSILAAGLALGLGACAAAPERPAEFSSSATAEANVQAALTRIRQLNPKLNAVIAV